MTCRTSSRTEGWNEPITSTALETLVLWPRADREVDTMRDIADPWPVFVVAVGLDAATEARNHALLKLLDTPRSPIDTIINSDCWWTVADPDEAMLCLSVRVMRRPVRVAMDIAVPAQCFLGLSDIVTAGATIGVTTRRHARRLTTRIDDRTALDEVVLLGGRTSGELGELAAKLCSARARA
jgi:hypothetical protein